ncbi:adenine phosphoribosyltransferase [candidate division WOR-3 bacterium]|uniref:Adenine phosphoribosyltransferase n=1 Tax=candidate division WOR-3 bacterium TaxID=2052148 RepID=A0A660SKI0_UNCW3|nr:MAG: adenine phosphoribosyltransferase [candidate division WOR-3 bacterium]
MDIKKFIRDIPDFPKPGIIFKDITPLLLDPDAFGWTIEALARGFAWDRIDKVASVEARGFIFGAGVARYLKVGFIPIRKPGKLPYQTIAEEYELEYGTDRLEIHTDAVKAGEGILIIDDLLATGGTALATAHLVEKLGGRVVGIGFVIELAFLKGREKLKDYKIHTLIKFT